MHFHGVILTEIVRQEDAAFKSVLTEIRSGDRNSKGSCIDFLLRNSSSFPMSGDDSIFLVPTNKKAKEINDREMAKLPGKEKFYYADVDGDVTAVDKFAEDEILIREGCKVMTTVNASDGEYVNGTMGIAKKVREESVDILTEDGKLITIGKATKEITKPVVKVKKVKKLIPEAVLNADGTPMVDSDGNVVMREVLKEAPEETIQHEKVGTFKQLPIRIAYAITVHKSQGKTFQKINLDPYAWDEGQFYTALSRGKKIENICFLQTIQSKFIKTSPDVKQFMKDIERASKEDISI
jgi:ATP-dependent exoDNAse (exonuclease V) alpha subunit